MTATMIKFVCGGCGERLSVPERFAGRKGACPNCKSINRVPLRGFPENKAAAPVHAASEISAVSRANGNGAAHTHGNGSGATTLTPELADRRGRIQTAVPPVEAATSRMRSLIDPPPAKVKAPEPVREPANSNGTYVHPLVEAVSAPTTDWSDPPPPVAKSVSPDSSVAAARGHGVLAPDEYTPGERWKRAWEEPKPGLAQKILATFLPRRAVSAGSRPGERTLDDGISMPLKIGMLLGSVAGLVGMIYLVLYFLLWSHLNMSP